MQSQTKKKEKKNVKVKNNQVFFFSWTSVSAFDTRQRTLEGASLIVTGWDVCCVDVCCVDVESATCAQSDVISYEESRWKQLFQVCTPVAITTEMSL